jgi:hypothetical protein
VVSDVGGVDHTMDHLQVCHRLDIRVGRYWNCNKSTSDICCSRFKSKENSKNKFLLTQ